MTWSHITVDSVFHAFSLGGPMPGMNPQDPNNPPFRPPGPARHGLLGNAPPGYNPMMVGGRPPFPPQGMC